MAWKLTALAILATLVIAATFYLPTPTQEATARNETQSGSSDNFSPKTVINTPLKAITNAPFKTAIEGSKSLGDSMLVLGVDYNGVAKAYPISMLCGPSREIINDTFGDQALAATW